MSTQPRLKLALIGLDRLGAIRARILSFQQPRIELVAACDTKSGSEVWAATYLPPSVKFFADTEDCMKNSGAQAVLISTATATHAPLICHALDLGLHVMCEKPISVGVITAEILTKAASKPRQKFLVPFCRRYDDSYQAAKRMVESGSLGQIHAAETTCLDQQDPTGFFVTFSTQSGGIFVDMGVHDVDIGRYFLDVKSELTNPKKQVNRVIAMGQQAFANGKVLTTHLGRTLTNGFEGMTRVCGTKGHSVINNNSPLNRVEIRDSYGVRAATTPDAFALYDKSIINDLSEFADVVLDDNPLTCTPDDAYEAAEIATALQYSVRNGVPVYFDDNCLPIIEAAKVTCP
ncbi:NAD(P)-binding protein [Lentithecium fluviatile CBS 122367]|uniref:NAD(P)-binding protein n=1 Tax=Lentithecium fluviatile CBS 122367 TaxID=1168545 RepID=A0A6G1ICM1_9PLEO|nr:NAD(P)-binding protein [Lentithecium fluviatile CBS 122367]